MKSSRTKFLLSLLFLSFSSCFFVSRFCSFCKKNDEKLFISSLNCFPEHEPQAQLKRISSSTLLSWYFRLFHELHKKQKNATFSPSYERVEFIIEGFQVVGLHCIEPIKKGIVTVAWISFHLVGQLQYELQNDRLVRHSFHQAVFLQKMGR